MKRPAPPLASLILFLLASLACSLPASASTPEGEATSLPTAVAITPTAVETPTSLDPCLLGTWTMDTYALNNKFLDLTQSPSMMVIAPSFSVLEFRDDNTFATSGQITVRFDINASDYLEMDGLPAGQGSYTADGSTLTFSGVDYGVEFGAMRAFINGQAAESPMTIPMPEDALAPPASAGYACAGNAMTVTYDGPSGTVIEEWIR